VSVPARVVAVTGSASGIGAAVCSQLEADGCRVIGVDLRGADVTADLSARAGRTAAAASLAAACAGRLDGLVCCAGIGPHVQPAEMIARVNYFGAVELLDAMLPRLAAGTRPGAVVIASNSAGLVPLDQRLVDALLRGDEGAAAQAAAGLGGATVYAMSKLALIRAVRRRAGYWGEHGVRLNAVAPGPVDTPLLQGSLADPVLGPLTEALPVPLGRRAGPGEIAGLVTFLLGPASGYIHGSVVFADGGTDALLRPDAL
jgi:NAD(P)-dependent dehydrogenase (short-subunit alcohol dehydrogenase family)